MKELEGIEALVKTLKGLAEQNLSTAEEQRPGYFPQGLFQGSALAYENAARWLERELSAIKDQRLRKLAEEVWREEKAERDSAKE